MRQTPESRALVAKADGVEDRRTVLLWPTKAGLDVVDEILGLQVVADSSSGVASVA